MKKYTLLKFVAFLFLFLISIILVLPNTHSKASKFVKNLLPNVGINLGLDLKGGSQLLLEINHETLFKDVVEISKKVSYDLESLGLPLKDNIFNSDKTRSSFSFSDTSNLIAIQDYCKLLQEYVSAKYENVNVTFSDSSSSLLIFYKDQYIEETLDEYVAKSMETIRNRIDENGTKEVIIQRKSKNQILVEVPGIQDPGALKILLGKTAKMSFHLLSKTTPIVSSPSDIYVPVDMKLMPSFEKNVDGTPLRYFLVKERADIDGSHLKDARATFQDGKPVVNFRFDQKGSTAFADITSSNIGNLFAVVLDGEVITSPQINEPIIGGSGVISGGFYNIEEAERLAIFMRSGSLPVSLEVVEERTIGPSLGAESVEYGKLALIFALIITTCVMIFLYGYVGMIVNIGLILSLFLIVATMSIFQFTLTLPGIAGLVLTIGMSVDANILILERIKEELALSKIKKVTSSVLDRGFSGAFTTIIDSNLTTLVVAVCLFYFGSGPIKGFAVTLSIGILASMFAALVFMKFILYYIFVERKIDFNFGFNKSHGR